MRRIYKDGVMTLELSLLMPGILSVLIIIIFTSYYYHDRCVIERGAYSACIKCAEKLSSDRGKFTDAIETEVIQYFETETAGRFMGNWDLGKEVYYTEDEIGINVYGNMSCLNGIFTKYLSKAIYSIDLTERAIITNYGYIYK